jgi:hypothetical protein
MPHTTQQSFFQNTLGKRHPLSKLITYHTRKTFIGQTECLSQYLKVKCTLVFYLY